MAVGHLEQGTGTIRTDCSLFVLSRETVPSSSTTFFAHYRGEDDDERIDVWSEFYVSDRMTITESELKRIKKEKNSVWTFSIPAVVPPLDKEVAEAWTKMVEY